MDENEPVRSILLNHHNIAAVAEDTAFTEEELRDVLIEANNAGRSVRIRISGIQIY